MTGAPGEVGEPAPPAPARATGWWAAVAVAVAFLAGCVGWAVGSRSGEPAATFNDVDRGFLADMTAHHDQAVEMALLTQGRTVDKVTEDFAREVVIFQRWELGRMKELLTQAGAPEPGTDPDRTTMAWMGMPTTFRTMPGIATDEQIDQLEHAQGLELERQFLTLMRAHHLGGVHMADYEAEFGTNPVVRDLATRMAATQRSEANEYTLQLQRLGLEP